MKRNRTVDFLKFILSLMIVPIHADLFIDVSRPLFLCFTLGLVRVGVPFFFIVSGYYLKERVDQRKSIKNSIIRYLKLFAVHPPGSCNHRTIFLSELPEYLFLSPQGIVHRLERCVLVYARADYFAAYPGSGF